MALFSVVVEHHHYFHSDPATTAGISAIRADIANLKETFMTSQAETAARIDSLTAKVNKVAGEMQSLKDAVANSAAATDPAVTAALDRLDAALTGVDDMNEDAPTGGGEQQG